MAEEIQKSPEDEFPIVAEDFSVVALGDFNPAIFQPYWFAVNDLVAKEKAAAAEIIAIQKDLAVFQMEKIHVQVETHRFAMTTSEEVASLEMCELFKQSLGILEHTPLHSLGFNRDMQYFMPTDDSLKEVMERLAPRAAWDDIVEQRIVSELTIGGYRKDTEHRNMVRVQPVKIMRKPNSSDVGLLVAYNQHYDLRKIKEVRDRIDEVVRVLTADWISFIRYAYDASIRIVRSPRQSTRVD